LLRRCKHFNVRGAHCEKTLTDLMCQAETDIGLC